MCFTLSFVACAWKPSSLALCFAPVLGRAWNLSGCEGSPRPARGVCARCWLSNSCAPVVFRRLVGVCPSDCCDRSWIIAVWRHVLEVCSRPQREPCGQVVRNALQDHRSQSRAAALELCDKGLQSPCCRIRAVFVAQRALQAPEVWRGLYPRLRIHARFCDISFSD